MYCIPNSGEPPLCRGAFRTSSPGGTLRSTNRPAASVEAQRNPGAATPERALVVSETVPANGLPAGSSTTPDTVAVRTGRKTTSMPLSSVPVSTTTELASWISVVPG